jgi:hypothetical protein
MAEFVQDPAPAPHHTDEYLKTVYACGQRRDHQLRVHRAYWPPRSMHGLNPALVVEKPHVTGPCERCGANLIVYDPPDSSVTVVLYGDASEAVGRVEDGAVVDEAQMAKSGGVIDEPAPSGRKGR